MFVANAVTVEDGALAKDGANAPPPRISDLPIWTTQMLARASTPAAPLYSPHIITTTGLVESVPYRQPPSISPDTPQMQPATITRDVNSGVTINPSPVNDATQTPTAINQIDGTRAPAPTTAVLQARPTITATPGVLPKLTRNEIIALVLLAALVIL